MEQPDASQLRRFNPVEETPRLTKDGHSAIARMPDGLPSTAALGRNVLGLSQRPKPAQQSDAARQSSWRCPLGSQRRAPLYRNPLLPVYTSSLPGGHGLSVEKYRDDTRDWRKLLPEDIARHFSELEVAMTDNALRGPASGIRSDKHTGQHSDALQQLEGLISAVMVGTLQSCHEKSYWAPSYGDSQGIVVEDVRSPTSRLVTTTPDTSRLEPRADACPELKVCEDLTALAACRQLALTGAGQRVALVRFSPAGDRNGLLPRLTDHREAQLFMQTTYTQALQDMPRHLHADPIQALDAGSLIYSTDVAMLRGPIQDGAPWLADAPLLDIIWVALQRNPKSDDQGQYSRVDEKALAASTIDRIFACAALNGVDAIVFPPAGVGGAAGCRHPAEDMGDLLRKAALTYANVIPTVWVCKEYSGQLQSAWAPFAAALTKFREPIVHRELVPMAASPYIRPGWEPKKTKGVPRAVQRRLDNMKAPGSARGGGDAVLGSAGRAIAC